MPLSHPKSADVPAHAENSLPQPHLCESGGLTGRGPANQVIALLAHAIAEQDAANVIQSSNTEDGASQTRSILALFAACTALWALGILLTRSLI